MNSLIKYTSNKAGRNGCTIAFRVAPGYFAVGCSKLRKGDRFERGEAIRVAKLNALENQIPLSMKKEREEMQRRAALYFKGDTVIA